MRVATRTDVRLDVVSAHQLVGNMGYNTSIGAQTTSLAVTVIALLNGEEGDGPGGTADLVAKAQQRGAKTIILNTKEIF